MLQIRPIFGLNSLKLTFQFNEKARIILTFYSIILHKQKMRLMNCIKLMIIITCYKNHPSLTH